MKVLIVDDNPTIAGTLARTFEESYQVESIYDYFAARERLSYMEYDVVCLDVDLGLEHEDGITLCRYVREKHPQTIIIIFTGQALDEEMASRMLEAGANSFVQKGGSAVTLLQKSLRLLEEQRKVSTPATPDAEIYSHLSLDENKRVVVVDGEERSLDPMPFRIFQELFFRPNTFVHTASLIRQVKNPMTHTGISIKVHISHIRKAIHPYEHHVRNRWGGWYGFFEELDQTVKPD